MDRPKMSIRNGESWLKLEFTKFFDWRLKDDKSYRKERTA